MITATTRDHGHTTEYHVDGVVNRDGMDNHNWLVLVPLGFEAACIVVRADNEQDAIDYLADSKWAHLIAADPVDVRNDEEWVSYAGNYGTPVYIDELIIRRCRVKWFEPQSRKFDIA